MLLARDFAPARPTRRSAVAAAPAFLVALGFMAALVPDPTPRWTEAAMSVEFMLLWATFFVGVAAASNEGLARFVVAGWAVAFFAAIAGVMSWAMGSAMPLVALAVLLAPWLRTLFARDRFFQREVLWVRALLTLVLAWVVLFAASPLGDRGIPAWGAAYFTLVGLADLLRVLAPPDPVPKRA